MKKIFLIVVLFLSVKSFSQELPRVLPEVVKHGKTNLSYKNGEWLKYRLHYGFLNAGFATLKLEKETLNGKEYLHATGIGKSTGVVNMLFKVRDNYQTYIDPATNSPKKFLRKIREGGHKKDKIVEFDQKNKKAKVTDKKRKTTKTYSTKGFTQDMLSVFYYLRNMSSERMKNGNEFDMNVFMDEENYTFKVKVIKREVLKTKFGTINCIKLKPYVQSGRIFKKKESVDIWVTDDENHIPVSLSAKLLVGSIKMDLYAYKNISHKINFKKKKKK